MSVGQWLSAGRNRRLALLLLNVGLLSVVILGGRGLRVVEYGAVGTYDFVAYWSAARVTLDGGNPYDPTALLAVEQTAGWPFDYTLLMYNPPWTLILTLPLGLLGFGPASVVRIWLHGMAVLGSGVLLWHYFAPEERRGWLGLLVAAGFFPSFSAMLMGQSSFWFLVGVVGFLWAERREWDVAAGAALALLMIKPHITYLFWVAALWWAWRAGRWRVVIGWVVALIGASGLVLLISPNVFANYAASFGNLPLDAWHSPTLGTWTRLLLNWKLTWLQFVPSLLGGLGLVVWLWRRRGPWHWEALAGPLLLASVVTAAYGWSHDQVVLLPAVMALVGGLREKRALERVAVLILLAGAQLGLASMCHWAVPDAFAVWHAPLLAGLYWWSVGGEPHIRNRTSQPGEDGSFPRHRLVRLTQNKERLGADGAGGGTQRYA